MFCVGTGVRPEEAFGGDWTDVDLEAGVFTVRRAFAKGQLKSYAKTARSRRRVPLRAKVLDALHELPRREDVLFPASEGGRINKNVTILRTIFALADRDGRWGRIGDPTRPLRSRASDRAQGEAPAFFEPEEVERLLEAARNPTRRYAPDHPSHLDPPSSSWPCRPACAVASCSPFASATLT
jgi:integrase